MGIVEVAEAVVIGVDDVEVILEEVDEVEVVVVDAEVVLEVIEVLVKVVEMVVLGDVIVVECILDVLEEPDTEDAELDVVVEDEEIDRKLVKLLEGEINGMDKFNTLEVEAEFVAEEALSDVLLVKAVWLEVVRVVA